MRARGWLKSNSPSYTVNTAMGHPNAQPEYEFSAQVKRIPASVLVVEAETEDKTLDTVLVPLPSQNWQAERLVLCHMLSDRSDLLALTH
jgi:hypothetical protein